MLAMGGALMVPSRLLIVDELSLGRAPIIVERLVPCCATSQTGPGPVSARRHHVDLALRENRHLLEASYVGAPVGNN